MDANYASEAQKHLRTFDWLVGRVQKPLAAIYGETVVRQLIVDTRDEFARLIPQLPYIGDRNLMKSNLLSSAAYLGLYRAALKQGMTLKQAGLLLHQTHELLAASAPDLLRRMAGKFLNSSVYERVLKMSAENSVQHHYPGDWVYQVVDGDNDTFDWGLDVSECAVYKFYRAQGAEEFMPYACALDFFLGKVMGYQFFREGTLPEGAPVCRYRYKKEGETRDWPVAVKVFVPGETTPNLPG